MLELDDPPPPPEPLPGSFHAPPLEGRISNATIGIHSSQRTPHKGLRHFNPICNCLLCLALLCLGIGWWTKGALPDAREIQSELRRSPSQQVSDREAFDFGYKGEVYTVEPLAEYEIAGLIVSHNNPQGWGDIYHDDSSVDFRDLCVIWGPNVVDNNFHNIVYWSESWTCNIRTSRQEVYEQFDPRSLSNNHLLSNDARVERILKEASIGDQIWLKGMLVSYYPRGMKPMARTSSLTRNDIGNGACEVVFVEDAMLLSRGPRMGYLLYSLGGVMLCIALVLKLAGMIWVPLRYYRTR